MEAPSPAGLTASEVASRLGRDGPNRLPPPPRVSAWRQLLHQMTSFFAFLLWGAGALAFVAGIGELGVAIFVVVLINAGFAFVQEHRAEHAAQQLHELLPRRVTVIREGVRRELDAEQLVVDDLVALGTGDRVSADLEVSHSHGLSVDTSTLTGETVPVAVARGETVYAGTFVTEGEGLAVVRATSVATRLARIAELSRTARPPASPLALQLRQVVRTISTVALGVGGVFFGLMLLLGTPPEAGFIFAVGITVALVPEGLLPTVTLSLSVAAQRMARRNGLVRHLEAVETLGSTTFVCTDKTGTLTRNEMMVVEVWTPFGTAEVEGDGYNPAGQVLAAHEAIGQRVRAVGLAGARCSTGHAVEHDGRWAALGDPMEAALDVLARRAGTDPKQDAARRPETARYPFDPRRRRMAVAVEGCLLVKGAPDAVLPRCVDPADGQPGRGASGDPETALAEMTGRGLRVLAIAQRTLPAGGGTDDPDRLESDLELLGLVGIEDQPREHVEAALAACRRAGVRVAMITGDHPATASAVAHEIGLWRDGAPEMTGAELPEDDAVLGAMIDRDGVILSRVSPEDKLRIARALRERGHVVAMTGDGVNDGPALQAADIGVAMGRGGTDVARDAADLVLLDDDFATIVAAIEQGRGTFSNIRRFLTYHLTDNVAELTPFVLWAVSGGQFPLALGVLQILALDIGTDTFTAVALGAERPSRHVLDRPPPHGRLLDALVARRAFAVLGPAQAGFAMLAFLASYCAQGWRPGEAFMGGGLAAASGAAFAAIVFGQTANAFACRSTVRPFHSGWRTNPLLLLALVVALLLGGLFLLLPPIADLLGHRPPPTAGWAVAMATAPAVLLADTIDKRRRGRHHAEQRPPGSA
jgi:magnesium-transporting ATPase (P-type)